MSLVWVKCGSASAFYTLEHPHIRRSAHPHFTPAQCFPQFFKYRSESSREQKFHGAKVLGTFTPKQQKIDWLTGAKVPSSKSSWTFSSTGANVPSVDFSLPGTKVQRNEKSRYRFFHRLVILITPIIGYLKHRTHCCKKLHERSTSETNK